MSSTVKSFRVTYDPVNHRNTFTNGDRVTGRVALEVAKDCQIDYLLVKLKGKAEVMWHERHHQRTFLCHDKEKYLSLKQYFIRGGNHTGNDNLPLLTKQNGETYSSVVAPGCHVYPFTFQIPFQNIPSSFTGSVGKIVYSLEAKLSRSMRVDKTDSVKINFVAKADLNSVPGMMTPQHDSTDKKMKVFSSGTVAMDVKLERKGFYQGEGLNVQACIQNNSSREVTPKYCVYRKHSFFARGRRRLDTEDLLKEVGEPIGPSANEKVTRVITIPHDVEPSILNCNLIKSEYRLKVYLDVKYASDPEVKLPIVILPASQGSAGAPPPAAAAGGFGFESFGNPNPPPGWGPAPAAAPQPFDPPPAYGAHGMYPPLMDHGNKY